MKSEQRQKLSLFLDSYFQFRNADSHDFFLFLLENRTFVSILMENYRELNNILKYHESKEVWRQISIHYRVRFRLQTKIKRLLSNYISSVYSLVDYSRKSIVKYL